MAEIDYKLVIALQQADEIVLRFASRLAGTHDVALLPEEKDFISQTVAAAVGAVPNPDQG